MEFQMILIKQDIIFSMSQVTKLLQKLIVGSQMLCVKKIVTGILQLNLILIKKRSIY